MARKDLKINGTSLNSMGIYITSDTYLNAPQIDYSEFQIPGRNGSVIMDNHRLNNVIRRFDCYIPDDGTVLKADALSALKNLLYANRGYVRLQSGYDTESGDYQMGYLAEGLDVSPFLTTSASFSLYFSCLPQRMKRSTSFTSTLLSVPSYDQLYFPNDPIVVKYLAKAKQDYPSNIIGWVISDAVTAIPNGTTATIKLTSSNCQKYMIINTVTGAVVKEVRNYNQTFTYNNDSGTVRYLSYLVPVSTSNIRINVTTTSGNAFPFVLTYSAFPDSNYFTNSSCYDCMPIIYFTHEINEIYNDAPSTVDVFTVGAGTYVIDLASFVSDYTADYILSNLVTEAQIEGETVKTVSFELDTVNGILKAFPKNGNTDSTDMLDISGYLHMNKPERFGNNVPVKVMAFQDQDELIYHLYKTAAFDMRWWAL